jgi:hypothetical protein
LASRDPLVAGTTRPPSQYSQTDIQNYATEREYESSVYRRAESTIASLSFIANYLGRLPGRKNLVWISGGFPFSFGFDSLRIRPGQSTQGMSNLSQEIERGARALDNANLAIYPIDARGLMTSPVYSPQERVLDFSKGSMVVGENEQATMRELAERTGGRAYFNTNGITEAIRQAEDDSRVSYAMAYYPSLTKWDGKFHRIKVSTSRPGVHLRYRLGYFALPEVAPTDEERKATLEAAVFSPLDATAVPLRARATPEGGSLSILLHVDPSGITLNSERGRWIGSLDLLSEQFSQDGQRLKDKSIKLNLNLKQETYERLQLGGFSYTYPVEVLPEANRIRVVVRDNPSGAIGSLDIKVK